MSNDLMTPNTVGHKHDVEIDIDIAQPACREGDRCGKGCNGPQRQVAVAICHRREPGVEMDVTDNRQTGSRRHMSLDVV